MASYQPVIVLGIILIGGIVILWHARARERTALDRVMHQFGFQPAGDAVNADVDFTTTVQWPEGRGINYLRQYARDDGEAVITVAEVECWEMTGDRLGKLGAAMTGDHIRQTVLACRFPGRRLPSFNVCPRAWADQYELAVEGAQFLTTGDRVFDEAFCVLAPEPAPVDAVLTPAVRKRITAMPNLMLAAGNESVLLFNQGVVLPPHRLKRALDLLTLTRDAVLNDDSLT